MEAMSSSKRIAKRFLNREILLCNKRSTIQGTYSITYLLLYSRREGTLIMASTVSEHLSILPVVGSS